MEAITVILDPGGTGQVFDAHLDKCRAAGMQECGDLKIVTKDRATEGGRPGVGFFFTIRTPDGSLIPVQCVTTVRCLQVSLAALRGRYPQDQ